MRLSDTHVGTSQSWGCSLVTKNLLVMQETLCLGYLHQPLFPSLFKGKENELEQNEKITLFSTLYFLVPLIITAQKISFAY